MFERVRSTTGRSVRCAIYTRKSTEEGLEQVFNSLHAQREACEAYILSQRHEGWHVLPAAYDDGGYSGATMERPGLQTLIGDIKRGLIDIVVVYKVDRLTRSLRDFARIVDVFDASGISFVSVTQAFNTANSMGRLTLNVLLSFAQFEREVTAERIRDKITASKKKGIWMGGVVPLGYDVRDRGLIVAKVEAEIVRAIFKLYLDLGSVRMLRHELDRRGIVTKQRLTKAGPMGGRPFSRGQLYRILANPIYVGRVPHKKTSYPSEHRAIIDQPTFDAVQQLLKDNAGRHRGRTNSKHPSLLAGLMFTADGVPFTPSHAVNHGKRYRYYVERPLVEGGRHSSHDSNGGSDFRSDTGNYASRKSAATGGWRLPAHEIEALVLRSVSKFLRDPNALLDALRAFTGQADWLESILLHSAKMADVLTHGILPEQIELIRDVVDSIIIDAGSLTIKVGLAGVAQRLMVESNGRIPNGYATTVDLKLPIGLRRRGVEAKIVVGDSSLGDTPPKPDPALLKMLARAYCWQRALLRGAAGGLGEIARAEGLDRAYVSRVVALACLAPDIIQAILHGRQPPELTAKLLLRTAPNLPLLWEDQRRALGFAESS